MLNRPKTNKKYQTVALPKDLVEDLKEIAKEKHLSLAKTVELTLREKVVDVHLRVIKDR